MDFMRPNYLLEDYKSKFFSSSNVHLLKRLIRRKVVHQSQGNYKIESSEIDTNELLPDMQEYFQIYTSTVSNYSPENFITQLNEDFSRRIANKMWTDKLYAEKFHNMQNSDFEFMDLPKSDMIERNQLQNCRVAHNLYGDNEHIQNKQNPSQINTSSPLQQSTNTNNNFVKTSVQIGDQEWFLQNRQCYQNRPDFFN